MTTVLVVSLILAVSSILTLGLSYKLFRASQEIAKGRVFVRITYQSDTPRKVCGWARRDVIMSYQTSRSGSKVVKLESKKDMYVDTAQILEIEELKRAQDYIFRGWY